MAASSDPGTAGPAPQPISTTTAAERVRLRARLLEFLKFRVLASQEDFFQAWRPAALPVPDPARQARSAGVAALQDLDLNGFRRWLQPLWPQARDLADEDLHHCLEQAYGLYVDRRPGDRCP
ncbi:MAG: hypothetical protein ACKOXO_04735 [Cyanobium sp.]